MRDFQSTDLLKFEFLSDPRLSPTGDEVVFVRHKVDAEDNGYQSRVYLTGSDGSGRRPLTAGAGSDSHPRWSPDGRWLAFLSDRPVYGEKCGRQIWILPAGGGEAYPLTRIEGGVGSFVWSPDGDKLAAVCRFDPDEGLQLAGEDDQAKGDEESGEVDELKALYEKYTEDVKHIKKIKYKADGAGFLEDKRSQVALIDFDAGFPEEPEQLPKPRVITSGDYDHRQPAFCPDGKWLAVTACRAENPDMQRFSDIWLFPVEKAADSDPVRVTDSLGPAHSPSWSPDGSSIAYLGNCRERRGMYTNTRLWLAQLSDPDRPGECELVDLTADYDVSFGDRSITDMRFSGASPRLTWDESGETIYYLTSERGTTQLVSVDAASGKPQLLTTGDRAIFNAHIRPDIDKVVAAVATAENPNELSLLRLEGDPAIAAGTYSDDVLDEGLQDIPEEQLVGANEKLLAQRRVYLPQRFTARAEAGSPEVDGWIILPDADEDGDIPAVLQIHGGPTAMYTGTFFFEFQLMAAQGWAVVFTNPRGSSGYGEGFCAAIEPAWGDPDYADVMAGMETALQQYPQLDEDRLGVAGGSYGGYMTNWVIGHTDQFAAAVTMRCVSNVHSFWGTSDIGYMWDEVWGGHPWEVPETYRQQSPLSYLHETETPTLVIHSEEDHRCPVEQGEQVYATLKKRGIDTEFIRYPNESHGLSRGGSPWHRIHRLDKINEWFERYI